MKAQAIETKSLLASAFEILLEKLGPRRTTQVWQTLSATQADYNKVRPVIFKGQSISSIYKKAKKFNKNIVSKKG